MQLLPSLDPETPQIITAEIARRIAAKAHEFILLAIDETKQYFEIPNTAEELVNALFFAEYYGCVGTIRRYFVAAMNRLATSPAAFLAELTRNPASYSALGYVMQHPGLVQESLSHVLGNRHFAEILRFEWTSMTPALEEMRDLICNTRLFPIVFQKLVSEEPKDVDFDRYEAGRLPDPSPDDSSRVYAMQLLTAQFKNWCSVQEDMAEQIIGLVTEPRDPDTSNSKGLCCFVGSPTVLDLLELARNQDLMYLGLRFRRKLRELGSFGGNTALRLKALLSSIHNKSEDGTLFTPIVDTEEPLSPKEALPLDGLHMPTEYIPPAWKLPQTVIQGNWDHKHEEHRRIAVTLPTDVHAAKRERADGSSGISNWQPANTELSGPWDDWEKWTSADSDSLTLIDEDEADPYLYALIHHKWDTPNYLDGLVQW